MSNTLEANLPVSTPKDKFEVVYTLEIINERICTLLKQAYGEFDEIPEVSLARGKTLFDVLKIVLDDCIGKRKIPLITTGEGPYSIQEICRYIEAISPNYHFRFEGKGFSDLNILLVNWIRSFPDPEIAGETDLMNLLSAENFDTDI